MKIHHFIPEKNIICAIATAVIAIGVATAFAQAGGDIATDGTTCITAARPTDGIYLSVNQIIWIVAACSVIPPYIWDIIAKHRAAKKQA